MEKQRLEGQEIVDVKLGQELQKLMGGRKSAKEEELTRAVLLKWVKRQGAVKEVNVVCITVRVWEGRKWC